MEIGKNMKNKILFVCVMFCLGCAPDKSELIDSFAYVSAGGFFGSGFSVSKNMVITACHVLKDPYLKQIKIENAYGDVTYSYKWKCDSKLDIAYLLVEDDIFDEHLTVKSLPSGVIEYGCFAGLCNNKESICIRCRTVQIYDEEIYFVGSTAIGGMSGGACVVKRFGETFAIGVLVTSYHSPNSDNSSFSNWGSTKCAKLRASDYWDGNINWD